MDHAVAADYTNVQSNENVQVFVRMRPPEDGSEVSAAMVEPLEGQRPKKITIRDPNNRNYGEVSFAFDRVFDTKSKQNDIFDDVAKPLMERTLAGYNTCCFAYGQTGSGKTYSMFGEENGPGSQGIIPRAVNSVFSRLMDLQKTRETAVVVSFLEIYCDQIRDLGKAYLDKDKSVGKREKTSDWYAENRRRASGVINPDQLRQSDGSRPGSGRKRPGSGSGGKDKEGTIGISKTRFAVGLRTSDDYYNQDLRIHEDLAGNVFVKDLSVIPVSTPEEVLTIVKMGFKLRATHETKMNAVSSRSHTVFTLTIVQKDHRTGDTITGMLNLVDLAGSERLDKSESKGQRMREALSINTSLTALGKVIMALDPTLEGRQHVPYRDSKLTRLLQNSLGGNSYTALLATLHPMPTHHSECVSTLQFANRCRNVTNQPRVNYIEQTNAATEKAKKRLMSEITQLKRSLSGAEIRHQQQLVALMAQLGIKGNVLPDGRFQTATGEVIGMTTSDAAAAVGSDGKIMSADDLASVSMGQNNGGASGAGGMIGVGGGVSGALNLGSFGGGFGRAMIPGGGAGGIGSQQAEQTRVMVSMKRKIEEQKQEKARMKRGLEASKHELQQVHEQAEQQKERMTTHIKRQHDIIEKVQSELEIYKSSAENKQNLEKEKYEQQMEELMVQSQKVMAAATKRINDVPAALRVRSDILAQANNKAADVRQAMVKKYTKLMETMKGGYELEIENLKQQHAYLMETKKEEQRKFVNDFNKFYEKKTAQINDYKDELVLLYQHCCALSTIVTKMETNVYPVRTRKTGVKTFAIPPEDRPRDIFKDPNRLKLLREQLRLARAGMKRLHQRDTIETAQPYGSQNFQIPSASAGQSAGALAPSEPPSQSQMRSKSFETTGNRNKPPELVNNQRAKTAGAQQVKSKARSTNENGIERTETDLYNMPNLLPAFFSDGTDNNLDLEKTMADLSIEELKEEVRNLRNYVKTDLRRKVEEQILNDLSGHETVQYIKAVEDERDHYRKQVRIFFLKICPFCFCFHDSCVPSTLTLSIFSLPK